MEEQNKPLAINNEHFSFENFPNIIGFCEKDELSHVTNSDEQTYQYKLHSKLIFVVKKRADRWEIAEYDSEKIVHVNSDKDLATVLMRALVFKPTDKPNDKRVNILFPIKKIDIERAQAIMYYLGGYPRSFFPYAAEFLFVKDKFINSEIDFLAYPYVPVEYISWLREELKKDGIIGQDKNSNIWIYRK